MGKDKNNKGRGRVTKRIGLFTVGHLGLIEAQMIFKMIP
jgi:hypothetical protein